MSHDLRPYEVVSVGELSTRTRDPHEFLAELRARALSLRPDARYGSRGQWFAVLLDSSHEAVLTSESFSSPEEALAAARAALAELAAPLGA